MLVSASSGVSRSDWPTLLIRISIRPCRCKTDFIQLSISASTVASPDVKKACPPALMMASTVFCASSAEISRPSITAPCFANSRAMAPPLLSASLGAPKPVITAIFPDREKGVFLVINISFRCGL